MSRCLSTVVLPVCFIVSITASARSQGQSATRIQPIVLEISIVEMTGAQLDVIEKIEKSRDQLNRLMSEGKVRLIASLQVRTRAGESFSARVGQRVPIQTATLPSFRTNDRTRGDAREPVQPQLTSVAVPQIAYEHTGLTVEGSSTAVSDGVVDIMLKLEMTALDRSTGSLTPTFTQRTFTNVVRMKESETAMLMRLTQSQPEPPSLSDIASGSGSVNLARGSFIVLLTTKPVQ
ncbi:MAG: hypothetical protein AABN33_00175 [Acidobacteriota bacterium]